MQVPQIGGPSDQRALSRGWQYALAASVVVVLWGLTLLSFRRPETVTVSHTVVFNVSITTASLLVSLGAAYFVLSEFTLYGRLASLLVGTAFLLFGLANGTMGLVPLYEGWKHQTSVVPYVWAMERVIGGALLMAAPIVVQRVIPVRARQQLVILATGTTLALSAAATGWLWQVSSISVPHLAQVLVEIVASVLFFGAAVQFWQAPRHESSTWYFGLSLVLVVAGFAELQYAIHPYDSAVARLGDLLRLIFYSGILVILGAEASRGYRQLRWQTRELSALQALMAPPSVQDVQTVIHHVEHVVEATFDARARVMLRRRDADAEEGSSPLSILNLGSQHAVAPADVQTLLLGSSEDASGRAMAAVPLRSGERQFGMLVLDRPERADFSPQDSRLLRAFGMQASVLLERSLLYEEVAAGAVMQERSRLAREIHDGLAQHLAFLKMRVSWLKRSPAALDVGQLIDLEGVLETALTEARTAITTLRAEPEGTSTSEAISSYAQEFGDVSGLDVQVDVDGEVPEVGPKARVELMRVVQEALNNVRKHANAHHVLVRLSARDGGMEVSIHDDGAGFTLKEELQGHFGMDIMNERAESIGGRLDVVSAPRRGTNVRVWVPAQEASAVRTSTQG